MLKNTSAGLPPVSSPPRHSSALTGPSRTRYYVLILSFMVGLVMYLDRACMGAAAPMIMRDFSP
jgi:hypothetical protein